jgi:hypothetical protein
MALCLTLHLAQSEPALRVDWSSASGADSDVAAVRRDLVRAVNAGDPAAKAFYRVDAVGITPDRSHATITLVPRRFEVGDRIASETGIYTETRDDKRTVEGLYVAVYTRGADNRWRVAMEVWSTGSLRRR